MSATLTNFISRFCSIFWLAGPIFTMELRIGARRKRNYFLRFAYTIVLTLFVAAAWSAVNIGTSGSNAAKVSMMPRIGTNLIISICWFQFIAAQLIAVVLLSDAINNEIYHRTLGILMTTPISCFQIVTGKLCAKLLHLTLLLAISCPVLAIVRVFGGVPWDYIVSSLCITLTAAIFAASVSLLFSIHTKKAHEAASAATTFCGLFYIIPMGLVMALSIKYKFLTVGLPIASYTNPFAVMAENTDAMLLPAATAPAVSWPLHCLVMLVASSINLFLSSISVRTAGRRQAAGQLGLFASKKERKIAKKRITQKTYAQRPASPIKYVKGPPIIWREIKTAHNKIGRAMTIIAMVLAGGFLITIYGIIAWYKFLDERSVQMAFIIVYMFIALYGVASAAAQSITSEREARTWPILLTTPLDDRQIILGKILGSVFRVWPVWALLIAHLVVFTIARCIHPIVFLPMLLLIAGSALFVAAVGVFFSSNFKRTSRASLFNTIVFFIWFAPCCPFAGSFISPITVVAAIFFLPTPGSPFNIPRPMTFGYSNNHNTAVAVFIVVIIIYLLLALVAYTMSRRNIRSKIF
jgi:ABC-type transport system involved in multi-copper enzyme maturation permease subunit